MNKVPDSNSGPSVALTAEPLYVIFDGPPSHESGRFVEVETGDGRSVRAGEWEERPDGLWSLGPLYLAPVAVAGPDARDALLRDAERYRWLLREKLNYLAGIFGFVTHYKPESISAAIDAALGQQAGGPATTATEKPPAAHCSRHAAYTNRCNDCNDAAGGRP